MKMYHLKAELEMFFESFFNILSLSLLGKLTINFIVNFNLIASKVNSFFGGREEWVVYSKLGINFPYLLGRRLFVVGTYLRLRA